MLAFAKRAALAGIVVCVALAASAVAAEAPPSQAIVGEGPGGRTALTRWTLRRDPSNRGNRARLAARAASAGASVSVPNVIDPTRYAGASAQANYEGSVAWYRTTFAAPAAGTYALSFQSANFPAQVWVDGHALGSHRGSYLPFEPRARLGPPADTRWSCASTGATPPRSRASAFTAPGSTGAGSTARSACVRSARASCPIRRSRRRSRPASSSACAPPVPTIPADQSASVRVSVQVRNDGASGRAIVPTGSLVHGVADDPAELPRTAPRPWPEHDREHERDRARTGAVVAREPEPVPADARGRAGVQLLRARGAAPAHLARRARVPERTAPAGARRHASRRTRSVTAMRSRRATRTRSSPSCARSARTRCAPSIRWTRRCWNGFDAAGHPRVAGHRPGRRRRQLVLEHARAARARRAPGAHRGDRRRNCTRRSSPGTSSTRSPRTGATAQRSPTCSR